MSTQKCTICARDPERMNNDFAECSHCECPHRRSAWSERTSAAQLFKGPWPKNVDRDPLPLDAKEPTCRHNRGHCHVYESIPAKTGGAV